jgi:putative membrane protein
MPYLTEASKQALTAAVESIERQSAAEVVVAVRDKSGSMLHSDLLAGALGAFVTLAFLLFSRFSFSLEAILMDTVLFGALSALLCSRWPALRFRLTPRRLAAASVARAARAEFFDAHISETRARTGVLVYVSQTERTAEVLADCGVRSAVDVAAWEACVRRIRSVVESKQDGVLLAKAVSELGSVLASCLPRAADDVDELANQVRVQ